MLSGRERSALRHAAEDEEEAEQGMEMSSVVVDLNALDLHSIPGIEEHEVPVYADLHKSLMSYRKSVYGCTLALCVFAFAIMVYVADNMIMVELLPEETHFALLLSIIVLSGAGYGVFASRRWNESLSQTHFVIVALMWLAVLLCVIALVITIGSVNKADTEATARRYLREHPSSEFKDAISMVNYAGSFFETLSYLWDICALFVALLVFLVCQLRVKTNRFSRTSRQLSFEREDFIRKYQRRERDVRRHQESKKAKLSKEKKKKQSASRHKRKEKEGAGLKDKGVLGHEDRVREKRSSLNTAGAFTLAPLNDDQTQKKKKRKKKKKSTMG